MPILYIYSSPKRKQGKITRPNWRCGTGTPDPGTSEAPTSGLETLRLSPCFSHNRVLFGLSRFYFL